MRAAPARTATRAALAVAVLLAACRVASAEPAQYHGAIGYSPATGAMGWSFDYPNPKDAREVALTRCAEHATDCAIVVEFKNGCGVVVEGHRLQTAAGSPSRSDAGRMALRRCQTRTEGCVVRRWVCTTRSMY